MKSYRILIIGNCQVTSISKIISILCSADCEARHVKKAQVINNSEPFVIFSDFDFVFMNKFDQSWGFLAFDECKKNENVIFLPSVVFTGSHPDSIYVKGNNGVLKSPIGDYHSSIIANSFVNGLSENKCLNLFRPEFLFLLGYGKAYDLSIRLFKEHLSGEGLDGELLVSKWATNGHFMHTINHPKLFVLEDIVKALLTKNQIDFNDHISVSDIIADTLLNSCVFPIYPGLGRLSSSRESFLFKSSNHETDNPQSNVNVLELKEFISESYRIYSEVDLMEEAIPAVIVKNFKMLLDEFQKNDKEVSYFDHPYKGLPKGRFWSKSISTVDAINVNPVAPFDFVITPKTKVATAGSCFAQHIARALSESGMNYYVEEKGPNELKDIEKLELGYGLYSARYGNIYTTRQLLQLFDRAYEIFKPKELIWNSKGNFVDAFRPNIGEVFTREEDLLIDIKVHLESVRKMFENLDVFIFTLGLTECWENIIDGSIYPVAPGVISENLDNNQYRFMNLTYEDVVKDLHDFIWKLRAVNSEAKIVLTVSPVPLVATKVQRHVLISNTASKAILRIAVDSIASAYSFVEYFPSFEIITGNFNQGKYYGSNLRSVKEEGVEHVMKLFMQECTSNESFLLLKREEELTKELDVIKRNTEELAKVICDEELLDDSIDRV